MNIKKICVFDFETDGQNPEECNPVQLAAVIVCPRKLKVIDDATFESGIKPPNIDDEDYFENHKSTIEWHARISKCSTDDILQRWHNNPAEKDVWPTFLDWLSKYHTKQTRQTIFTAPIACGYNINDFDLPIIKRLATKYGDIQKDGKQYY
jgi:DNA polymerase III epsilon subunit-like protein